MKVVEDLISYMRTDFQRKLLAAVSQSLQDIENALRLNNFSTGFRELVRDIFQHLAPDEEIKKCAWYVPNVASKTGVTRKHRVSFVIHGGIPMQYAEEQLNIDIVAESKSLVAAVDTLSKFTHVTPKTIGLPPEEVDGYVESACDALKNMMESADAARKTLCNAIEAQVHEEVVYAVFRETVMAIDEIATHHTIEDVMLEQIEVIDIGAIEVRFKAYGTIETTLQWGSNSDVRNDQGAVMDETFPVTLEFVSSVNAPAEIEAIENSMSVDTTGWYDATSDHEQDPTW
jgi:hypothetical protein